MRLFDVVLETLNTTTKMRFSINSRSSRSSRGCRNPAMFFLCICQQLLLPSILTSRNYQAATASLRWSEALQCIPTPIPSLFSSICYLFIHCLHFSITGSFWIRCLRSHLPLRFKFGHSSGHLEQRLVQLSSDHSGNCLFAPLSTAV